MRFYRKNLTQLREVKNCVCELLSDVVAITYVIPHTTYTVIFAAMKLNKCVVTYMCVKNVKEKEIYRRERVGNLCEVCEELSNPIAANTLPPHTRCVRLCESV